MSMGMKRALAVLAMAKEGRLDSARELTEAQQVTGRSVAELHTGPTHIHPYAGKARMDDDEDQSDTEVA